jgi:hypothetical protein
LGGPRLLRGALAIAFAFALTFALVVVLLELQDLERFRVDLGFESAALGIGEPNFITAVVDLQPLYLPALGSARAGKAARPSDNTSRHWLKVRLHFMGGSCKPG